MALQTFNTTADVYRSSHTPPAAPDVAGIKVLLQGDFPAAHQANIGTTTPWRWTHVALVDPSVDVRDPYVGGSNAVIGEGGPTSWQDTLYVPDKNGVAYNVVFIERVGRGTAGDVKRIYLQRGTPSWPSNNL